MPYAIKDSQIQEVKDDEVDIEIPSYTRLVGTNASMIPMYSNAQSPRLFYAARFVNQSMPMANREAPLVQSLDPEDEDGRSFEEKNGERVGALRWHGTGEGTVKKVTPTSIIVRGTDGKDTTLDLYKDFPFNRKTAINSKAKVQEGDKVQPGQLLASSNYTDDSGTMSMGVNARVAMVPYLGYSMDDAIVISQSFADKLASEHAYEFDVDKNDENKFGRAKYHALFPMTFNKDQMATLDDNGVVKPGTVLHKGDPIILAVKPKKVTANGKALGRLSRVMLGEMEDVSEVWEHEYPGYVSDTADGKKAHKAFVTAQVPATQGDKLIFRNGQKNIIAKVIPDEHMLRSLDGTPFEALLNPLSLPSRVNTATPYELLLGKLAQANGEPVKVPAFMDPGKSRLDDVMERLKKAGISDTEEVFDPLINRKLQSPVLTGIGYVQKLHHVVESKISARGNSGYDQQNQPRKGGDENAQAKRLGGLETTAIMARGGYAVLREGSTIRGTRQDDYWRQLRQGYKPAEPGVPFVFDKFRALLNGAGVNAKDMGKGVLRLAPFTDKDLSELNALPLKNGKLVNPDTLETIPGGLFDPQLVASEKWGRIDLPRKYPNPAFEKQIAQLLGIKIADLHKVIARQMTLEEAQKK